MSEALKCVDNILGYKTYTLVNITKIVNRYV